MHPDLPRYVVLVLLSDSTLLVFLLEDVWLLFAILGDGAFLRPLSRLAVCIFAFILVERLLKRFAELFVDVDMVVVAGLEACILIFEVN